MKMKTYLIHFQTNPFDSRDSEFEMVGFMKDVSHNAIFTRTQNFEEYWNTEEPCRSSMVGDIFEEIDDDDKSTCYRVNDIGLSKVDHPYKEIIDLLEEAPKSFWKNLNKEGE